MNQHPAYRGQVFTIIALVSVGKLNHITCPEDGGFFFFSFSSPSFFLDQSSGSNPNFLYLHKVHVQ